MTLPNAAIFCEDLRQGSAPLPEKGAVELSLELSLDLSMP